MALNRENRRKLTSEMEKLNAYTKLELERARIDEKNKFRNITRCLQLQRKEQEDYESSIKSKADVAYRERQLQQEEKLAIELNAIKREELREEKMRQLLRENSPELKELEAKLRAAYVNKELHAQIAEKESRKLQSKLQEKDALKLLQKARVEDIEFREKQIQDEINKKHQYKIELQDQMIFKEKSKKYLYEEFLREKKMLDDVVQRIHEEDERALQEKYCKMQKTKLEMENFKKAQAIWRQKEKNALEEENRKIQEYLLSKHKDIQTQNEEKRRLEERKNQISEEIAKQIYQETMRKQEREMIIQELLEQERMEAEVQKHKAEVEKEMRMRIEMKDTFKRQLEEKHERLRQDAEEDAKYKEYLLAKIEEDDKLELLSAQNKRIKMLQLRKDVEDMMADRRRKRAEELQTEIKLKEQEELELASRKQLIEQERIKMLREHAKNLIGYMPRGILRDEDLQELGSDYYK